MKPFSAFSKLFPLWVILASAVAYAAPGVVSPLVSNLRLLFVFTMFCTGLVLKEEEIREIRNSPLPVGIGVTLQYLVMPLSAFLISLVLPLAPEDRLGIILTGSVPGAMASNAMAYLAGGDVAYSVAMTVSSTALSPVATPYIVGWLSGTSVVLDTVAMMADILLTVVLPVVAGFGIRYFFTGQVVQAEPMIAAGSVASITGIIAAVTAQNSQRIMEVGAVVVLAVVLLNAAGYFFGYMGARLAGLGSRRQLTVALEVGMQNAGLSTVLANRYFSPEAALAGSFYTVWCVVTGSLLSPLRREFAEDDDPVKNGKESRVENRPGHSRRVESDPSGDDRMDFRQKHPGRTLDRDAGRPLVAGLGRETETGGDDPANDDDQKPGRVPVGLPGNPVILDRSQHPISRKMISPEAQKVLYRLRSAGYRAFLVGGSVRDLMLGRKPKDFDVATDASPRQVAKLFRNARVIGRRFKVVHVRYSREIVIEVATFRAPPRPELVDTDGLPESEFAGDEEQEFLTDNVHAGQPIGDELDDEPTESDALKIVAEASQPESEDEEDEEPAEAAADASARSAPRPVQPARHAVPAGETANPLLQWDDNVFGTAEEDAFRRDLTINGLFYDIDTFSVIDYVGGLEDLKKRVIRTIGDPNIRFLEDPVRMIRAIRHASRVGFEIEPNTWEAIRIHHEQIRNCSRARVLEEFLRELSRGCSCASLALLEKAGLLTDILPPLAEHLGSFPGVTEHQKRAWRRFEEADRNYQQGKLSEELAYTVAVAPYNDDLIDSICSPGSEAKGLPQMLTVAGERIGEINRRLAVPRRLGIPAVNIYLNFMVLRRGIVTGKINARLVGNSQRLEQCYDFYVTDSVARGETPLGIDEIRNLPRQKKKGNRGGKRRGKRTDSRPAGDESGGAGI